MSDLDRVLQAAAETADELRAKTSQARKKGDMPLADATTAGAVAFSIFFRRLLQAAEAEVDIMDQPPLLGGK